MSKSKYEVTVGNVGNVHTGSNKQSAKVVFLEYVRVSNSGVGSAGGEDVTLWKDGEPIREFWADTDMDKLDRWIRRHPRDAMTIARRAVIELYTTQEGRVLHEDDDFPSGADYISYMTGVFAVTGVADVIEKLRKGIDP